MKLSILLKTGDYRGDHATDIFRAVEYHPNENVEELVKRARLGENKYVVGEVIEIRVMEESL